MNEIPIPQLETKTALKAILFVIYTMMGVSIAVLPVHAMPFRQFPVERIPHFEIPAYILLGVVLIAGMLLGARGKASASWAVIAYGSLCVALLKYMASSQWYNKDQFPQIWVGTAIATGLISGIIVLGLRAAYLSRWRQMFAWSLLVHLGICCYTPTLLYAQYAYCQRHNLLHRNMGK